MKTGRMIGLAAAASLLLCMQATSAHAGWMKYATGGVPYAMIRSADGSYVIAGRTSTANIDAALWKLNSSGELSWVRSIGGGSTELFTSVTEAAGGGYVAFGWTESAGAGSGDLLMAKFDASGGLLWQKTYGTSGVEQPGSVFATSDGGFVFCGRTDTFGGGEDALIVKTDAGGNISWTRTYDKFVMSSEHGSSVIQTGDGGYFVAGTTSSSGTDALLMKLDGGGATVWSISASGPLGSTILTDAVQTTDGGFLCVGRSDGFGSGLAGWAVKVSGSGSVEWQRGWDSAAVSMFIGVERASGSDLVLVGLSGSGVGGGAGDALVMRISASGSSIWQKAYGGDFADVGMGIANDGAGGFVVAAGFSSFTGATSILTNFSIDGNGSIGAACAMWAHDLSASSTATSATISTLWLTDTGGMPTSASSPLAVGVPSSPQTHSCGDTSGEANLNGAWTYLKKKGSKVNGKLYVYNTGSVDASDFDVKIYFSKKPNVNKKSTLVRTTTFVGGLPAGGTSLTTITATPGKGHKYVVAKIDANSAVSESSESDNVASRKW